MAGPKALLTFLSLALPLVANAAPHRFGNFMGVPIDNADADDIIPNKYIVVFNNTFSDAAIEAKQSAVIQTIQKRNLNKRGLQGQLLSTKVNAFKMNGWRAMALESDDRMILDIMNEDEVAFVEADVKVKISATVAQTNAPPGLIRLSHADAGQDNYIFDNTGGQGITAFIIDTGIKTTHTEFSGRATFGANFVNDVVRILKHDGTKASLLWLPLI
jgi:subtilisin family serine protease